MDIKSEREIQWELNLIESTYQWLYTADKRPFPLLQSKAWWNFVFLSLLTYGAKNFF